MNDDSNGGRLSFVQKNMAAVCRGAVTTISNSLRLDAFPVFVVLLFLGALFWAKAQDPFSRRWFALETPDHHSFHCVAVLPKPVRRCPVVVLAHGSGGALMTDGNDLRQMAELGLAAVSLDYDQTNEAEFDAQWTALMHYLGRQAWADTNAVAWVGCSLGANWIWQFRSQKSEVRSQLLVLVSGQGLAVDVGREGTPGEGDWPAGSNAGARPGTPGAGVLPRNCAVLLVHGEQDEIFPVADTVRLAEVLRTTGVAVTLRVVPGAPHNLEPERGVVFRGIGEYCLSRLGGPGAWRNYHSIARWQAEAPGLFWFWIPAMTWMGWRWGKAEMSKRKADGQGQKSEVRSQEPEVASRHFILRYSSFVIRLLAVVLGTGAVVETALHLAPPHFSVDERTLAIARRILVQPKERADFDYLAAQPIWSGVTLRVLLDHVELAVYNRELVNWQVDDEVYREYVLSPVLKTEDRSQESGVRSQTSDVSPLDWRRALWEEFYPRIRHENSPADAVPIVARHLRERVTIAALPGLSHVVPEIWLNQITDKTGFAIIYLAALRSVGVAARLAGDSRVEFWDGSEWQAAGGEMMKAQW